ncbi:UDP-glycosyltransferase UGT5-like isoform X2 [Macrosteles quadrilineatus]|uniref:UDP-glycosyltransferase UGT5-like isoform X2 n=1 Tax=Macrosteles quadrilineatus TaxID=74068 RepID=UPI0023E32B9C|nr:UDP-glycosyltransferase UGT5-like isoform X2 [Macrosteles quadrilineatus]
MWWSGPLVVSCVLAHALSADILAVFPHTGKSHFDVFEPLVLALADRGHHVTVISFYPQRQTVKNITDISLVGLVPLRVNQVRFDDIETPFTDFISMATMGLDMCEKILSHSTVKGFLRADKKVDAILIEFFNTNCFFSLAHKYAVPFIGIGSASLSPDQEARIGNPWLPAYVSNPDLAYSYVMGLSHKIVNVVYSVATRAVRAYYIQHEQYVVDRLVGHTPPLEDIARNVSVVLVNTHSSMLRSRPMVPGFVEVGGIHIRPQKVLDEELERFMDESSDGVLLFSMGSVIQSTSFPADKRHAIMDAFAELPVQVLMKWESDTLPGKPPNVKLSRWLPQRDILAHAKVRAFMGHGGMLSTSEALHCGVPMVLIPMFGDQPNNVAHLAQAGVAIPLSYDNLSKETVLQALQSVLNDPRYRLQAQAVSAQFRDRPMSPLETAVYWTEYVIRHKGATHLRSPAVDMPWYQLWLLDVLLVVCATFTALLIAVYWMAKCITKMVNRLFFSKKTKNKKE